MANLHRLEADSPNIGGVFADFGPNLTLQATWCSAAPIADTLEMGKSLAAHLLQSLLDRRTQAASDAARDTNWASVAAACQHHVVGWNAALRARIAARMGADDEARARSTWNGGDENLVS